MSWQVFFTALGLLLVFEGILPFLSPEWWRQMLGYMFTQSNRGLRVMGLISMLLGLALVTVARWLYS
jgi:uncharacterized protein